MRKKIITTVTLLSLLHVFGQDDPSSVLPLEFIDLTSGKVDFEEEVSSISVGNDFEMPVSVKLSPVNKRNNSLGIFSVPFFESKFVFTDRNKAQCEMPWGEKVFFSGTAQGSISKSIDGIWNVQTTKNEAIVSNNDKTILLTFKDSKLSNMNVDKEKIVWDYGKNKIEVNMAQHSTMKNLATLVRGKSMSFGNSTENLKVDKNTFFINFNDDEKMQVDHDDTSNTIRVHYSGQVIDLAWNSKSYLSHAKFGGNEYTYSTEVANSNFEIPNKVSIKIIKNKLSHAKVEYDYKNARVRYKGFTGAEYETQYVVGVDGEALLSTVKDLSNSKTVFKGYYDKNSNLIRSIDRDDEVTSYDYSNGFLSSVKKSGYHIYKSDLQKDKIRKVIKTEEGETITFEYKNSDKKVKVNIKTKSGREKNYKIEKKKLESMFPENFFKV